MSDIVPLKRALISVSDKTGLADFVKNLVQMGVEIISTGGTGRFLREQGLPYREVQSITGLSEMLDGRVKTLHPKIHGGILGRRDLHAEEAAQHQIEWIDLVVVNFYPFSETIDQQPNLSMDSAIEQIDIGGPTMVRAAAKNFAWVGVVVNPHDYLSVITELRQSQGLSLSTRKQLAEKAFALTSHYDNTIYHYFLKQADTDKQTCPAHLDLQLEKTAELRYGENPHQKACAYQFKDQPGILSAAQLQGKPLSYNNILDAEAAVHCVREFEGPACVIVKHASPCGVAIADTIDQAFKRAYQVDAQSAFGGIIALNRPCTEEIAKALASLFMEVLLAPAYTKEALSILAAKPNLRVLEMPIQTRPGWEMKFIDGGLLMQERDIQLLRATELKTVTKTAPSPQQIDAILFAWQVLKHIKSNGILIANAYTTLGIGGGQVSRVDAVQLALRKAEGTISAAAVLASDAFFPFRDSVDQIGRAGIKAIVQPGGSVRDQEVIDACNEHGIAMVFTGKRCFKH